MGQNVRIIAGAMSGTSADGVDVALVGITGCGLEMSAKLMAWHGRGFPPELREKISRIRRGQAMPIGALAEAGREISLCYAAAVNETLVMAGMRARDLAAVAAHGQTLYHDPPNTIQWLDPALLAAEVGSAVVSDFRRADCAAGGQGAPLVALADYLLFRHAKKNRALLNLGGIANLTYLRAGCGIDRVIAFDTGPGNCLSDDLIRQSDPRGIGWDEGGRLAGMGSAVDAIVKHVLSSAYFTKPPPKSTDGPAMIKIFLEAQRGRRYRLEDLARTACQITADAIAESMRKFLGAMPEGSRVQGFKGSESVRNFIGVMPEEIIVSGGGTLNKTMMDLIRRGLAGCEVRTIDELGIPSAAKEAMAFALLGAATLDGVPGNVPAATGASKAVVLGAVTPRPGRNPKSEIRMTNQTALLKSSGIQARAPTPALPRSTRGGGKEAGSRRISAEQNQTRNPNDRNEKVPDRSGLLTERRLAESMGLDRMSIFDALAVMNEQDSVAVKAVAAQRAEVAAAIEVVATALTAGGRLIYVGAGTSGRLGVLDAAECPPTFGTDPPMVQGVIAGGEGAMFRSAEGTEDREEEGAAAMNTKDVGPADVIIGIAAGGTTPFVRGALRRAAELGAKTAFLCCVEKTSGEPKADAVIRPLTGPEVLTGSTRLKAGTATKLVLNQITTLAMVRMGKVHENLMVDLKATNQKLWDRAARIVSMLTGASRDEAMEVLRSADGEVKTAIVMKKSGVNAGEARRILRQAAGNLRGAVETRNPKPE
jgi:N-acetylmuramic acid 6-phosphate etherase